MNKLKNYLNGEHLDTYKRKRETWFFSSIVSIFFPFFISITINAVSGKFDFLEIFSQGEIIILFYSLTIAVLFDLWNTPRDISKNDRGLQRSFYSLLIVLFSQMAIYGVIKANIITDLWILFFMTAGTIIASYYICNSTLLQIFLYNIQEVN